MSWTPSSTWRTPRSSPAKFCTSTAVRAPDAETHAPTTPSRRLTMEYFVEMTTHVPAGTPDETVDDIRGREAAPALELRDDGYLLRPGPPPPAARAWRTL